MKSVTVSAPGKIHLMGEHAVVYGKPALLVAINFRLTVTVGYIDSHRKDLIQIDCTESKESVKQSVDIVRKALRRIDRLPIHISISSNIPPGHHLGSSAALSVALTGALMKLYTNRFEKKRINDIAYRIEKIFHGNPSGGDNTTATYGKVLWYRKETEFLKLFSSVSLPALTQSQELQNFYFVDTGRSAENTKDMVNAVRVLFDKNEQLKNQVLEANESATRHVANALKLGTESLLIEAMKEGERTLEAMQVVSKKVMPLIRDIEKLGGSAKILGGGGKKDGVGYLLCYYRHKEYEKGKQLLSDLVRKYSYTLRDVRLGEEGVRIESTT